MVDKPEDHYRGVKDLLINPGIQFTRCKHDGATITKSSPKDFASLYFSPTAVLCCGAWDAHVMFKDEDGFLRPFINDKPLIKSSKDLKGAKKGGKHGEELLRCIWGEKLIGLHLFTRWFYFDRVTGQPDYKKVPEIFSIPLIADASQNTPRFCVVGANGFGIGQLGACKPEPSRNETSTLALLYWPGTEMFSYYTGGDGHPDVFRGPVQTWFNGTWPNGGVEMVKLDHHGSTRENLAEASGINKEGQNNTANDRTEQEERYRPTVDVRHWSEDGGQAVHWSNFAKPAATR